MATNTREITTVIFDFGGVLVNDTDPAVFKNISYKLGVELEVVKSALEKLLGPYQKGEIEPGEFWNRFSVEVSKRLPMGKDYEGLWNEKYASESRIDKKMLGLVKILKENGYQLGLLSNTIPDHAQFNRAQGNFDEFDHVILSCDKSVGSRKPEKRIYDIAIQRFSLRKGQGVFIDDKLEYAEAARDVGLFGIHHVSYEETVRVLGGLGIRLLGLEES